MSFLSPLSLNKKKYFLFYFPLSIGNENVCICCSNICIIIMNMQLERAESVASAYCGLLGRVENVV